MDTRIVQTTIKVTPEVAEFLAKLAKGGHKISSIAASYKAGKKTVTLNFVTENNKTPLRGSREKKNGKCITVIE